MRALHKGLLLGALQLALVMSLGAKLLIDRARLPRAWVHVVPFDPELPLRGRYVRLALEVPTLQMTGETTSPHVSPGRRFGQARLLLQDGQLVAAPAEPGTGLPVELRRSGDVSTARLAEPVLFFIPEHVPDPSRRGPDEELWVEVTVPKKGIPRPIRLGVKKAGVITPLGLN